MQLLTSGYLCLSAVTLLVIALIYGIAPTAVLPRVLKVTVTDTDLIHIFRAMMGLYIALLSLWAVGAFIPRLTHSAILSEVLFSTGLAAGRILSLVMDGWPSALLIFYLIIELTSAAAGILLLLNQSFSVL
jgi:Domain of unknown function (DUF4345)